MNRAAATATILALLPATVHAEPRTWDAEARAAYVVLGGGRPTGGLMPSLAARRSWSPSEKVDLALGARFGLFGLGGGSHWIGVLGGPTATATWHPAPAWSLSVAFDADAGRIPVCNRWRPEPLCLRFVGFFPAGEVGAAYAGWNHVEITATLTLRAVSTLAWSGPTFEPAAGGRIFW